MDYQQMTAPCGLDCWNCPVYLAQEDEGLKTKIAQNMGIPVEHVNCQGCRSEQGQIPFHGMVGRCER